MSKQNIEESVESRVCFEELEDWVREKIQGWVQERWTPSVGPLGGISKVDSAVLVAASKGNAERGRA